MRYEGRYSLSRAGNDNAPLRVPAVPSMVFPTVDTPRRVIVVVGIALDDAFTTTLAANGFAIVNADTVDEARAFINERMPVAILLRPSEQYPLVTWIREQEPLAFVQVFVSPAGTSIAMAIRAGADDVFDMLDAEVAERVVARITRAQFLAQLALLDPLTQLHNRRFMNDRLQAEVARAARGRTAFSIALIDLDNFKHVNDTLGHTAGDQALVAFANSLRRDLRAYDVLCRFGGDEFVVLFPDCDALQAKAALDKVGSVLGLPIITTFSAGIAQFPEDGATWTELFENADRHLLEAKANGRNQIVHGPQLKVLAW